MQEQKPDQTAERGPSLIGAAAPSTEAEQEHKIEGDRAQLDRDTTRENQEQAAAGDGQVPPPRRRQDGLDRLCAKGLEETFTYHAPDGCDLEHYAAIRAGAKEFALLLASYTPRCADQTAAIRHVREAVMTANAAVALKGLW